MALNGDRESLGTRVEVLPIEARQPALGMREEEWPTTSEEIAASLARMDALEPGWLSPEDDAAWHTECACYIKVFVPCKTFPLDVTTR
jgi:hypothetical protein